MSVFTETQNGAITNESSGSELLNFFGSLSSARNTESEQFLASFYRAFNENKVLATRSLFYMRDVRGGQGIREPFRVVVKDLATKQVLSREFVYWIAHYGRWDDTFALLDTQSQDNLRTVLALELSLGNKLLAKWMPREKSSKKALAKKLRKLLGLSAKDYRKLLSGNTEVVETLMCSNQWGDINYAHVPSQAGLKYKDAFARRDGERYTEYLEQVAQGNQNINASTLYPHQLVEKCFDGNYDATVQALWENLPNYLEGNDQTILPVVDVSGSMSGLPILVAIALGIYLSERNGGRYKNKFLTFSESPQWASVPNGSLELKAEKVRLADWGMSTNLESIFDLVLKMSFDSSTVVPDKIIILTDMEFNQAMDTEPDATFFEKMQKKYDSCGAKMPTLIFWNLASRSSDNYPVRASTNGTMLVSGFSPSIMTHILKGGGEITPFQLMCQVLGSDRYSQIYL